MKRFLPSSAFTARSLPALATLASLASLAALANCTSSSSTPGSGSGDQDGGGISTGSDGGPLTEDAGDGAVPDTFAWAQTFNASFGSDIIAMAADSSGVVVVGQITGTATIGTNTLLGAGTSGNAFVAKLDTNGNVLWAKVASGSESIFESVVIDASGNIYVSGAEYGDQPTTTFAGTTLTPNTSALINGNDVNDAGGILAMLGPDGTAKWVKLVETTTQIDLGSIALSGSNVIVAGALDGDAAFGPTETLPVTGCAPGPGCVAFGAFDTATGTAKWASKAASTPMRSNEAANPHEVWIGTDTPGNIYMTVGGYFASGTQQADSNQLVTNKYDPTGALTWSKSAPMPAGGGPDVEGMTVDGAGNVYAIGDGAVALVLGSFTVGESGHFFVKYSSAGDVVWANEPDLSVGTHSVAIGGGTAPSAYSFGNGDDPSGILPDTVVPMTVGKFDPDAGALSALIACGQAQADGKAVAASGTSVYVGGDGTTPGVFGRLSTTNSGLFVAKLK